MILRRPSAAACRPKSARRVRVGGERRVSLARHRDVGTQHLKSTPTASFLFLDYRTPERGPEVRHASGLGHPQASRHPGKKKIPFPKFECCLVLNDC